MQWVLELHREAWDDFRLVSQLQLLLQPELLPACPQRTDDDC